MYAKKNFCLDDITHRRLKMLAAQRSTTLGATIKHLLDLQDVIAERGTLVFQGQNGTLELDLSDLIPQTGDF